MLPTQDITHTDNPHLNIPKPDVTNLGHYPPGHYLPILINLKWSHYPISNIKNDGDVFKGICVFRFHMISSIKLSFKAGKSIVNLHIYYQATRFRYKVTVLYRLGFCPFLITISVLRHHDNYDYYWYVYIHDHSFWNTDLSVLKLYNFASENARFPGYFYHWTFFYDIGLNMLPPDSFMSI